MDGKTLLKHFVNFITTLGGAVSAVSLYFAFEGWEQMALILMGVGLLVDSLDGTIVRSFALGEALPRYDGDRLDEYADLITYVIAPVGFAWATELLPFDWLGVSAGMLVVAVSCLQFSRVDNKTDYAFWGWPSYWNIAYFYAWAAEVDPIWVVAGSLLLSIGVFVPVPFAYPSKLPKLRKTTMGLGILWGAFLFIYLILGTLGKVWLAASLAFPVYYFSLSVYLYEDLK